MALVSRHIRKMTETPTGSLEWKQTKECKIVGYFLYGFVK